MAEPNSMATFDRPPVIERLHNNVGKRKSTTPQKFVGGYFSFRQLANSFQNPMQHFGVFFHHQKNVELVREIICTWHQL